MVTKKYASLTQIQSLISQGKTSCSDLAKYYLNQNKENKHLNAMLEVFEEEVLNRAAIIDEKIKAGTSGKLAGMFLAIKDNICYKDHRVSASSKILENFKSTYTATALKRLLDEDVIVVGRCNCDEFAMGASNENSAFGPVKNAADERKVPGGSSGGSAVAVQADLCLAALGSDTGGSIRQPASFTGTVGLKPTYGLCSRWGIVAFASSLDQAGPMTKTIKDCAIMLESMSGFDEKDSTSINKKKEQYSKNLKDNIKGLKIGIPKEYRVDNMPKEVDELWEKGKKILKDLGAQLIDISLPHTKYALPTYYIVAPAEASSN